MSIDIEIDTKKLFKSLEKFPINVQKNVMTGAVRAGTKPLVKEARENAPKKTKTLSKSIGVTKRRGKDKTITWFSVSPRKGGKNDGWYAHMVEFGHNIVADGNVVGFVPPVPFMRTAYENQTDQSIKATREYLAKRIDKEIKKSRVN